MLLPQAVRVLWELFLGSSCHFLRGFAPPASPPGQCPLPHSYACVILSENIITEQVWLLHGLLWTKLKFAVSQLKMIFFLLSLAFGSRLYFSEFVPWGPHGDVLLCLKSLFSCYGNWYGIAALVCRKARTTLDFTWVRKQKFLLYKHGQQVLLAKPGCRVKVSIILFF